VRRHGWAECPREGCGEEWWTHDGVFTPVSGVPPEGQGRFGCWLCRSWLWRLLAPYVNRIGGRVE
jgi:hypothetical protein